MNKPFGNKAGGFIITCLITINAIEAYGSITSTLESESGFSTNNQTTVKNEVHLRLEFNQEWPSGISSTVIPSIYGDSENNLNSEEEDFDSFSTTNRPSTKNNDTGYSKIQLDEAYIDSEWQSVTWRLGKQQVVWGQADGLKVLDVINPQDFREFNLDDFQSSRIATWMSNMEWALNDDSVIQLLIISDQTFNHTAEKGTSFEVTSHRLVPSINSNLSEDPNTVIQMNDAVRPEGYDPEIGVRWSIFYNSWDITFNYFQHYHDDVVIERRVSNQNIIAVTPTYKFNRLYGMTANNAFGSWVIRLEAGYNSHRYTLRNDLIDNGLDVSPEINSVIGFDYQGITDWLISYQWFNSQLLNAHSEIIREPHRQQHSLLARLNLFNETLQFENFLLFSDEDEDGQFRSELKYNLNDNMDIWLGYDHFYGAQQGVFGQFTHENRWVTGFKYGF